LKLQLVATLLTAAALVSPAWQGSTQTTRGGLSPPPILSATDAPAGTETLAVQWFRVVVPDRSAMLAAVARPSGGGPFPLVLILHGTHGFARQYVQLAQDLARSGFLAVAGCWFSGGSGAGVNAVSPPIPCPETPPLGPGAYTQGLQYIDPSDARIAGRTRRSTRPLRTLTWRRRKLAIRTGDRQRAGHHSS
jgi:hypothetical protein